MNFIIYPDVILVWNIFTNFLIIFLLCRLTGYPLDYLHRFLGTLIISSISTILFVLFYKQKNAIYIPIYAATQFLMLCILFKCYRPKHLIILTIKYILSCTIIYGLSGVFEIDSNNLKLIRTVILLLSTVFISSIFANNLLAVSLYKTATLSVQGKTISATGFIDSGNTLRTAITNKPVIILDPQLAKRLFPRLNNTLNIYAKTGLFNYDYATNITHIFFSPLAYKTISNKTNLIPIFKLDVLSISSKKIYKNIYAGISPTSLSSNNEYQILIGQNLLSQKEDFSND